MKLQNDIDLFLRQGTDKCWTEFMRELSTDENQDYRRGFKAGLLVAHLYIKSQIRSIRDIAAEQCTE